jgi:hypothetical protein
VTFPATYSATGRTIANAATERLSRKKIETKRLAAVQWVIVTGVPTETDLKKFSAMNSGIRIQP